MGFFQRWREHREQMHREAQAREQYKAIEKSHRHEVAEARGHIKRLEREVEAMHYFSAWADWQLATEAYSSSDPNITMLWMSGDIVRVPTDLFEIETARRAVQRCFEVEAQRRKSEAETREAERVAALLWEIRQKNLDELPNFIAHYKANQPD